MKGLVFAIYLVGISYICFAQTNLVLNPSFEQHYSCPAGLFEVYRCVSWKDPTNASSDYFNSCCTGPDPCVPVNFLGFQNARNGNAYCGFGVRGNATQREYVEGIFSDSLITGHRYCVSFYVSLSDSSIFATDRIGAYLSVDSTDATTGGVLNYIPQVENPLGNIIIDTSGWALISGSFIAGGGEKYITIGNFYDNANTTIDTIRNSPIFWGAYYYVDDVSVIEMVYDTANAAVDTTICEGVSVQIGSAQCNGCTYSWQPTVGLSNANAAQPSAAPTQTTTYILTLTDTTTTSIDTCVCRGSKITTDTVTVYVLTSSNNANAGADVTICSGSGQEAVLGSPPCSGCTYQWQPFNNLNNSTIAQPTAAPTQTTTYILTMTDSFPPCVRTTTDAVNVVVEDCSVEVYNIFTPNGDTKNDFFFIKNLPANSALQIFNRWGSRVYESTNYNNKWDGGGVPDGTYYYILVLPSKESYHGFVEIRR